MDLSTPVDGFFRCHVIRGLVRLMPGWSARRSGVRLPFRAARTEGLACERGSTRRLVIDFAAAGAKEMNLDRFDLR